MDRNKVLAELNSYIQSVEKDTTMILQSLQWDKKHLFENPQPVACRYDPHHRMPPMALAEHEARCLLRSDGYSLQDELLPDPPYDAGHSLVKLGDAEIRKIINDAAKSDPHFKKVSELNEQSRPRPGAPSTRDSLLQPCSAARLAATYSRDERRAIHDAVVGSAPRHHHPTDSCDLSMTLAESKNDEDRARTREEMLALERDMKRRRAKYRGSVRHKNYSHTLRDLIATQMEMYTNVNVKVENVEDDSESVVKTNIHPLPSYSSHTSHTHRAQDTNCDRKGDKYRRNIHTDSTHRETNHFRDKNKNNSYNTDDYSSRRRVEHDSNDRCSSDSRYSHDRERNNTSDRQNARYEDKYREHSYDNGGESSKTKHRDRSNKYSYDGNRYRNSSDRDSSDKYRNTGSYSKSDDKYKGHEKCHRSERSASRSESKKANRSHDYDIVRAKEEPGDDYFCEPKRKRYEHH